MEKPKPLRDKLGIRAGFRMAIIGAPPDYGQPLGELPPDALLVKELAAPLDFIHFFARSRDELETRFPPLKEALSPHGALWVSWPKHSSGLKSDLGENTIREIGLANGLVDVKVIAIDDTWSGLKFVRRLKDR